MSTGTICNRCSLERMRANAATHGSVVTLLPDHRAPRWPNAKDIFVHGPDLDIAELEAQLASATEPALVPGWIGWFMELPDECRCEV